MPETCPNCHAAVDDQAILCPHCGTALIPQKTMAQINVEGKRAAGRKSLILGLLAVAGMIGVGAYVLMTDPVVLGRGVILLGVFAGIALPIGGLLGWAVYRIRRGPGRRPSGGDRPETLA